MPGYSVIADTTETILKALNDALQPLDTPPPVAVVKDFSGPISTSPASLILYLYEIIQDPVTRNRPMIRTDVVDAVELRKPPLPLTLRYMLTAFAGDRLTEQRILARAMQSLYDHPMRLGPDLQGDPAPIGLVGSNVILRTHLSMLTLEEKTRIWYAIQQPYRLCVVYEVRLVEVDAEEIVRVGTVRSRLLDMAVPA